MAKENQHAYVSKLFRCHACAARDREATRVGKEQHDPAGALYSIEKLET